MRTDSKNGLQGRIVLEGCVNFRDLGGYATIDGQTVRRGCVYRSDALSRLTGRDHIRLAEMGLRRVIDLRSSQEVQHSPDCLPDEGVLVYEHHPVTHGQFEVTEMFARLKKGDDSWMSADFMAGAYVTYVEDFPQVFGRILASLTEDRGIPAVFHCTGGKDRTGTMAVLLLMLLGVPRETVIADHQLSNDFIADVVAMIMDKLESYGVDPRKMEPYFTAPLDAVTALVDHLEKVYGGAQNYLHERADLNDRQFRAIRRLLLAP